MKKKLILLLALLMVMSLFLAACGTDEDPVDEEENGEAVEGENGEDEDEGDDEEEAAHEIGGTVMVGVTEISGNFNPAYYSSSYDGYVVDLTFQTLMNRDIDGNWVMEAADDWEVNEEGDQITFYMNEDNYFSDGEQVTAHDVVWSYKLLSDPSYTGRYGSIADGLLGYDEYADGDTEDFPGVVAEDDFTVVFTFQEPLRTNIANTTFHIMPEHYYGEAMEYGDTEGVTELSTDPIGSGPYTLGDFAPEEYVYLERNLDYMYEDLFLIEEILLEATEMTTEMDDLLTGTVDLLAGQIDPDNIRDAEAAENINLNSYPRSGYGYVKTNNEFGPTAEKEVRQALYYSFNLEEFVSEYFDGYANTQYHPYSQESWAVTDEWVDSIAAYDFDMDRAKEILDDADWQVGDSGYREKDGEELELFILTMPEHDILETLVPMWERDWGGELDINLNISQQEFNSILDTIIYDSDANVEEWSMFFLATTITSYDPHGTVEGSFHSRNIGSGQNNTSRYSNPELDEMMDDAERIMDQEEAIPAYQEIGEILTEDAAFMPVYANTYFDFYDEKIVDFETHGIYNWVAAMRHARIEE
ncbi:ABC transporter substrate-binding protein [Isachenkonia alkalipeptolytica]|uniref:ABC transporter substrate-binding protein n=1 Tax=Isachenkonia alkalipeptolytica TaxID=2565777 RepID=A0AA44BEE5_9CLOT|nr:ABC transporter substrate-binding protein [Isachenkonia alkalipeptolytica]NBG87446.1 ABC transporter substrate-binding protein [Isachenkonia alkalipeptolytica]